MAGRLRRGNSLIRGSGHSFQSHNRNRDSVLKRKSIVKGKQIEEDAAVFDLVLLTTIDEEHVITNIQNMYYEDMIYSYIGNVVISMNPFKDLPIYDDATISRYRGRSAFDPKLQPHIYALADNVFSDMTFRGRDQVVIISGESGAGKTEAAKKVMQYIAAVSKEGPKVNEIKDKLLTTNPLLESFGNAKTTRNDNSSRFGKYMDIQFDFKGNPCGGVITTYLLEKARVTRLGSGERNFHIFYQLLSGGLAAKFGMKGDAKAYAFLKKGEVKVRGLDDKKWFAEVSRGFDAIGFSSNEVTELWQCLGAVLLLGNVTFKGDGKAGSRLADAKVAKSVEQLIGTPVAAIEAALTHNTVVAQGDLVSADLSPERAGISRDTLCKAMYQRLFIWMCTRINQSIAVDAREIKAVIGVLDIYGFEIFQQNSFEQFCINYCNEKLQQLFIELTLKTEQDEYVREGIKWEPIKFFNNKIICDLVDAKRKGIVATLDEEGIRPGEKSDVQWLKNMSQTIGRHDRLVVANGPRDRSIPPNAFMLRHYAGDVTYTVDGFLDKNKDTLFKDLGQLMFESKSGILTSCFPEGDKATWKGAAKRPKTAGRLFIESMDQMIALLNTKVPSYVRCIKPNHTRSVHKIEADLMQHQVQYLGLVENVRVRRAGYCFRETYKDFLWRYRILSDKTYPHWRGSDKDGCIEIFNALGIRKKNYELGKTKVFIKHPHTVFRIEEERDERLDEVATLLQRSWRRYLVSKTIGGFFDGIVKSFQPVLKLDGRNPTYGFAPSKVVWPRHKATLSTAAAFLKQRVYGQWWARKMVGPLPPDKQSLMRLQFAGHTLFSGTKAGFSIGGSAMGAVNHAVATDPDGTAIAAFETHHGKIRFACSAVKISKKRKPADRIVVMTDSALYRTDKWKVKAGRFGTHEQIASVTVTGQSDGVVVLHGSEEGSDVVLNVGGGDLNLVYSFVAHLSVLTKKVNHALKVNVLGPDAQLVVNNSGKPGPKGAKPIRFMKDPAEVPGTRWNPGSKAFVYY